MKWKLINDMDGWAKERKEVGFIGEMRGEITKSFEVGRLGFDTA